MRFASLVRRAASAVRDRVGQQGLAAAAKLEKRRDRLGLPGADPGAEAVVNIAMQWLCAAQNRSKSRDGGVARDYSLINGWSSSYPETTGYIIPSLLANTGDGDPLELRVRARRMLDWLVRIQMPSGAFQAGKIDSTPVKPVTFNTGQIVLGLASGETAFGTYGHALKKASDWLVATQDADGCWRQFATPFAVEGEKTYETHVSWGLLEAERLYPNRGYAEAALKNLRWATGKQRENGWLEDCCLTNPSAPLTHTLGYAVRGLLEGYRFNSDPALALAARRTADALLSKLGNDGFLAGRFNSDWSAATDSACLTGTVQIAHCWLLIFEDTGEPRYLDGARRANAYVRRTVRLDGPEGIRGGVKGSFPIDGDYGPFEYLSWAAKFLIDSVLLEEAVAANAAR